MLRFAPSPTGDMHIGNLRAAILNYIIAKQRGEKFLIRIEDTDKSRNIDGADKEILQILNLFGLFWDKLVYQSDNFKIHNELAEQLVKKGQAFYCYATKEFLDKKRDEALAQKRAFRYNDSWAEICKDENKNPVIRLKGDLSCGNSSLTQSSRELEKSALDRPSVLSRTDFSAQPTNLTQDTRIANDFKNAESIAFFDEIKGTCTFSQNEIDSFVIIRDDGVPTYNFACAVDDMIYDISFIIRGEDHTSNTPKQILVHKKLGYEREIKYAHLPIILNDSGKKMSKRESESSVKWLLEQGFLPRAILNYLLLMGNNPPTEIFTLDDAIKWFDLSQLSKSPVRFDINQLRHINREHLRRLSENEMGLLLESSSEILANLKSKSNDKKAFVDSLDSLGKIFLEESSTLNEIRDKIERIFAPKAISDEFRIYGAEIAILKSTLLDLIEEGDESINDFNALKGKLGDSCKVNDKPLKGKGLFMPLRFLLTGAGSGPHLDILYPHLRAHLAIILRFKED